MTVTKNAGWKVLIAVFICSMPSILYPFITHAEEPLVERIQEQYKGISTIQGSFTQKSRIKDLGKTEVAAGTFMIKMPSRMRWQYTKPKTEEIIIKGDNILIYQKEEKQVLKGRFDNTSYGQAPIALLAGIGDIRKNFNISQKGDTLELRPKQSMGIIKLILLETASDGFPIKALSLIDLYGNRTDISFRSVKVNQEIKDSVFEFKTPPGVEYEYNP